ncbi:DUF2306 domain-containing protein [Pseudoalteromonas rhizosphaerae]|uniref:DUF2306 domain-containing protein n=1 Tax=Pseudoalteromonas rhizosphaerae TaxID=2518973 RepID=UPI0021495BCD|nr:DUF2306 domain-containing protein [Pseudoalteromonas rhizosphaerae]
MLMQKMKITPKKLLDNSKKLWFICLLMAQGCFVTYLILGYGLTSVTTGLSGWSRLNNTAYAASDPTGNILYATHVLLAIVMIISGSLQLIPALRTKYNKFHRYNGRVFVLLACTISMAGMYLIIVRGTVGNTLMHSLTIFAGCVVILSSILAVQAARGRNINTHQIWAIRLYLAANGVLFFRLMIFAWFLTFGSLGIDTATFTGPTVLTISICSYVMPLLIAELVRYAGRTTNKVITTVTAGLMVLISFVFLVGLFGVVLANWYPAIIG